MHSRGEMMPSWPVRSVFFVSFSRIFPDTTSINPEAPLPGSRDRLQPGLTLPAREIFSGVLPRHPYSPVTGRGRAGAEGGAVGEMWSRSAHSASWRTPSPVRAARRLNRLISEVPRIVISSFLFRNTAPTSLRRLGEGFKLSGFLPSSRRNAAPRRCPVGARWSLR